MANPDLRVLVGVLGGANISGESGQLIIKELKEITSQIRGNHMPRIKVAVNINETKQLFQQQLQQIVSGINIQAPVKIKPLGESLQVFDTEKLKTAGLDYIAATGDIVKKAKEQFSHLGQVDIKNIFKTPQGEIQRFTAEVKKSEGTVESFHRKLAILRDGASEFKGFVPTGSTGMDKTIGSDLQKTLNYLNNVETKIANITSKTTAGSAKPLLAEMPQFDDYNSRLQQVTARIQEFRNSASVISDEHKREFNSMVSDLQRYAKELQNAAYAGTELKAQTFAAQKGQYQADLEVQIKQWTNAGIFGGDFKQAAIDAKTMLESVTDSTGLDRYRAKLKLLQTEAKGFRVDGAAWDKIANADTLSKNIETAQIKISNLKKTYGAFVSDPKLVKEWKGLFDQSKIISSQKELTNLNAQISQFEQKLIGAGKHQASFLSEITQNFAKMSGWMIMGGFSAILIGGIRGMYSAVVDLNSKMVELKKVTDETNSTYTKFLKDASSQAIRLGTSITSLIEATANFAKLGFSLDDAQQLAEHATIYYNVGDGINSIEDATQSMISTMKAFGIESENAGSIIDKFNEIGNRFPITSGGIGEALQRSAASLAAANNTLDESIALITAANNVVQDPDSVGTMWKTVAARIRGAKVELEQAGLETDYMAESTSKLRDHVKALTNTKSLGGFDILSDEDTFKSTYDIILGISKVWEDITDKDRAALLELLAGKQRSNALAAAITNMADAEKVLKASANSAGSALEEHSKWLDSIEAKQQQFAAQYQQLSDTLLSSELIKGTIDAGTGLLGWLTAVSDKLGALPVLLSALTGIQGLASNKGVFQLDTNKNWGGSGIGITSWLSTKSKMDTSWADQIEKDYQALLKWEHSVKENVVSVEAFKKAMSGASAQAQGYAATMSDAGNSAEKYRVQQTAAAASTKGVGISATIASFGVQALNVAMNMLTGVLIGLAINATVAGFNALVNATSKASEKADEFASKQREISDAAAEEVKTLDELIERFSKLKESEFLDANTRTEVKDIQAQITSLVGDQANNLDLVNGKLDDQLAKLRAMKLEAAKDSLDSNVSTYFADRDAANKAVGQEKYLFAGGYGYVGSKDNAGYDILKNTANQFGLPVIQKGGFFNSNLFSTESGTAEERIGQLKAALEALKSAEGYDYTSSALYAGINQAIEHYQKYVDSVKASAGSLLESAALVSSLELESSGKVVSSEESYNAYRQAIIDATTSSKALSAGFANNAFGIEDVTEAVDNLMATRFPEWYDKVAMSASDAAASTKSSVSAFKNASEALSAAKAARDAYSGLQKDLADNGTISLDTLSSLVGIYPELQEVVKDYLNGTKNESAILDALAKKYTSAADAAGYNRSITEELADGTSELTRKLEKLSDVQSKINVLSSALSEFKENGIVDASSLSGLSEAMGNLESYGNFVSVLSNSKSTFSEVKTAVNNLAAEYLYSSGALSNLTEETADATIAQLKYTGVTNASKIVTARLAAQKLEAQLSSRGMTTATWSAVEAFLQESGAAQSAIASLKALRQEQYNAKLASTDFTTASAGVIQSLLQQAQAAGIATKAQASLAKILDLKERKDAGQLNSWEQRYYHQMMDQYAKDATVPTTDITANLPEIKVNVPLPKSKDKKDVEAYVAEIDKLYSVSKKLKDIQNGIKIIEARDNNLDGADYEKRISNAEKLLDLKQQENDLLHEQTEMRRGLIQQNVNELRGLGFDVNYDPKQNDLLINNLAHINNLVGKNQDATNELRKKAEDLIDSTESLNDANRDSSVAWYANALAAKEYKNQLMSIRQEQADEWFDIREHQNTLWENQGNKEKNIIANYQQMMDYAHRLANEYRDKGYSEESAEIRRLKELWWDYYNKVQNIVSDIDQKHLDGLNKQKDAMQGILDLTKELIEQETNDHIDALEKSRDIYKDIVDLKIKSLELTERERSYQDKVDASVAEISKLQAQVDALSLDDSRDAMLKRAQLLEEIQNKQKNLSDEQRAYSVENQKAALEQEYQEYSNTLDDKIDNLKAFLKDNERLTAAAYKRIDTEGNLLYDNLLIYARKYTNTSELEIKSMWETAMDAAKKYSSFVEGMNSIGGKITSIENGGHSQKATDDSSVISEMKSNGDKWHSASKSEREYLEARNQLLGASIGATRDSNGRWWRNGIPLYHTGGVIGDNPTKDQKDILMYGEKGELVLTQEMQKNFLSIPKAPFELIEAAEKALKSRYDVALNFIMSKLPSPSMPQLNHLNQHAIQTGGGPWNTSMSVVFNVAGSVDEDVLKEAVGLFERKLYEISKNKF